MKFENICIIGLGYIGLPTAAMFASCGVNVIGVDVSPKAVETINRGKIHIVEPGLEDLVRDNVNSGRLNARYEPETANAFIIAVPTPFKKVDIGNPEPDVSFIKDACVAIAPVLQKGNLVVLESTSPVGTTEQLSKWLSELRPDLKFPHSQDSDTDIYIAHCPERVLPGNVISELIHNDRIIGGITSQCSKKATALYKLFVNAECHVTNARTAEMAKLTENASRDVQIAFANELSFICDELEINVWELIKLANKHPRVNILQPGPGVGGHCIAVDPWFIVHSCPTQTQLIAKSREINDKKPMWVCDKINNMIIELLTKHDDMNIADIKIAFFGAAFKANIDDFRNSPAIKIISEINKKFPNQVFIVEPNANKEFCFYDNLITETEALNIAHIKVLLVDHDEFKHIQPTDSFYIDTRGNWSQLASNK